MKNFTIFFSMALLLSSVAQAEYVRKNVKPNFFIPARELNRVEKLPPLPVYEEPQIIRDEEPEVIESPQIVTPQPAPVIEDKYHIIDTQTESENVYVNPFPIQVMEQKIEMQDNILPQNKKAKYDTTLENKPQYKKMKESYLKDLKEIEEKGQASENPLVKETLEKMSSDDTIWVDENFNQEEPLF